MTDPGPWFLSLSPFLQGVLASFVAGMGTAVGALPVFLVRKLADRVEDGLLGFSAGVMLAASFFSLLLPALELAEIGNGPWVAAAIAALGLLAGALCLELIHHFAPHEHFVLGHEGPSGPSLYRIWLFIIAITLHNFPEGLAVGVGYGDGDIGRGLALTTGIGLQNIPEGLAVAVALLAYDYSRATAFGVATLTGLVEPVGGLVGAGTVALGELLLPWGLSFAAGAMLFIITSEMIPEMQQRGHKTVTAWSLMGGFVLMMILDVALG
ncbi:MAG: ZIP family metal transporter [Candidatus Competibacterales bacterium]|nr:ZIP family metal transporter [Candidatus Competibacterales bacterium]